MSCSLEFGCGVSTEHWTQNETDLSTDFSPDGTIDPVTGNFSESQFFSGCNFSTRQGTVAADARSFQATATIYLGGSPTLCNFPIEVFYSGTRCGTGTLEAGESCDDGNIDAGDGCDANCAVEDCYSCSGEPSVCTPGPDGPCEDANPCTIDSCDAELHCHHAADLRTCRTAGRSALFLRTEGTEQDKLVWKWVRGEATSRAELADPTIDAPYRFCVFAGTAQAVTGARIEPGATWSAGANDFRYRDSSASVDGLKRILLRAGDAGASRIVVSAKGIAIDASAPPLALPVTVQVLNEDDDVCWGASFDGDAVTRNGDGEFKGRVEVP